MRQIEGATIEAVGPNGLMRLRWPNGQVASVRLCADEELIAAAAQVADDLDSLRRLVSRTVTKRDLEAMEHLLRKALEGK